METSSKSQTNTVAPDSSISVSLKDRLILVLKFLLVGLVFYYLYQKGFVNAESFRRLVATPQIIAISVVLMLANTLLGTSRWKTLLDTQGAFLPYKRVLKLNLIGAFFNISLPGAVSGDFIKAIYVAKQFKDKRAEVFGSMLFDRILGVTAMVLVAAFSAGLSVLLPWGGSLPPILLYSVGGLGIGSVLFFLYLFSSHKKDPLLHFLQFFTRRNEKLKTIERLYHGVMGYRAHPKRVLKAVLLSIVIHVFLILLAFFTSKAICDVSVSVVALAVIVPIGMLATTIPILPAGVGTGHAAFYALFKMVGSEQGAEVFSVIVLYQVLLGLLGGLVYLKVSAEKDTP